MQLFCLICCEALIAPLKKSTEKVFYKKKLLKLDLCYRPDTSHSPFHLSAGRIADWLHIAWTLRSLKPLHSLKPYGEHLILSNHLIAGK